jgi:hypothetical protein
MEQPMDPAATQGLPMDPAAAPVAAGAPAPGGNLPAPNPEIMSPVVAAHMDEMDRMTQLMDPKTGEAYDRVVTAGMTMLYSEENSDMMQKILMDDEIPVPNKLGEGVANLMVMMDNQGNGSIPKEIIVPAGINLMFEAADYMHEVGIEVTEADLGAALELLIKGVLVGYGIDPAAMDKVVDNMGEKLGFADTPEGKKVGEMEGEDEAVTGSPEPGEKGIIPMDEEAAFQQGFKDERKAAIGVGE